MTPTAARPPLFSILRCCYCKRELAVVEMVMSKGKPHTVCLKCNRDRVAKWKRENPQKVSRITVAYGKRNHLKKRAHSVIKRALKSGRIVRPSLCERCASPARTLHAHHVDYSKPYDVKWLCVKCHNLQHSQRL